MLGFAVCSLIKLKFSCRRCFSQFVRDLAVSSGSRQAIVKQLQAVGLQIFKSVRFVITLIEKILRIPTS